MPKYLTSFLSGVASVLDMYPDCDYIYPDRRGFAKDLHAMRGDCAVVSSDVGEQVKRSGSRFSGDGAKTAEPPRDDSRLVRQQHETYGPRLPVAKVGRLQKVKPEAVDFILEQTEKEAEFRRQEISKHNKMAFMYLMMGQVFALIVGVAGVLAGCYIAYVNPYEPMVGASIAIASIVGLVVAFIGGRLASGQLSWVAKLRFMRKMPGFSGKKSAETTKGFSYIVW